ncbi:nucleotide disphospho-sugar-binding domain-containing protein [Mycolicibacterium sp. XJ2546]
MVAASPLAGHVVPMLRIGTHLKDHGHDVIVITGSEFGDVVRRAGLSLQALDRSGLIDDLPSPWVLRTPKLLRRYLLGIAEMRSTFVEPLTAQFSTLNRVLEQGPVDTVLADLTFTGVLPLVLGERPRPQILAVGVGPLTLTSADTPPFGMAWQPQPGTDYQPMNDVVRKFLLRGISADLNDALARCGTPPLPVPLTDWPRLADRLLQLTVRGFEYPRSDLPVNIDFVGPVIPDSSEHFEPPPWWNEIVAAPTVVHVTQGTFDNRNINQLIRPTLRAFDGMNIAVVATTGRPVDQTMTADLPRNAFVTDWIPYSMLLPHVDAVVTNGGYGGVHHALRQGIPLVIAGETSDKAEVAARVAYSGAGVNLGTATPTSTQIRAAVSEVLSESSYRAAAHRIGSDIVASDALGTIAERVTASTRASEL